MNTRTFILNCPVDLLKKEEAINIVNNIIADKKNFQIITLNHEMIMNAQKNQDFLNIINKFSV